MEINKTADSVAGVSRVGCKVVRSLIAQNVKKENIFLKIDLSIYLFDTIMTGHNTGSLYRYWPDRIMFRLWLAGIRSI